MRPRLSHVAVGDTSDGRQNGSLGSLTPLDNGVLGFRQRAPLDQQVPGVQGDVPSPIRKRFRVDRTDLKVFRAQHCLWAWGASDRAQTCANQPNRDSDA